MRWSASPTHLCSCPYAALVRLGASYISGGWSQGVWFLEVKGNTKSLFALIFFSSLHKHIKTFICAGIHAYPLHICKLMGEKKNLSQLVNRVETNPVWFRMSIKHSLLESGRVSEKKYHYIIIPFILKPSFHCCWWEGSVLDGLLPNLQYLFLRASASPTK